MELREIGEFSLIARIRKRWPAPSPDVIKGIGGDAAVASLSPGAALASTVDLLVESVHFDPSLIPASQLGRKCLTVNLSDVAAMGARLHALVSPAFPAPAKVEFTDDLFAGLGAAAEAHGVSLIGGDTPSAPGPLFIAKENNRA